MKKPILKLIRAYQKISFLKKPVFKNLYLSESACRFAPTCSEYCYQAIQKYGIIKGILLGVRRIFKCHPWNRGGRDPVP